MSLFLNSALTTLLLNNTLHTLTLRILDVLRRLANTRIVETWLEIPRSPLWCCFVDLRQRVDVSDIRGGLTNTFEASCGALLCCFRCSSDHLSCPFPRYVLLWLCRGRRQSHKPALANQQCANLTCSVLMNRQLVAAVFRCASLGLKGRLGAKCNVQQPVSAGGRAKARPTHNYSKSETDKYRLTFQW